MCWAGNMSGHVPARMSEKFSREKTEKKGKFGKINVKLIFQ